MTTHYPTTGDDQGADMTKQEIDVAGLRGLLAAGTPSGEWRAVEGDLEGGTLNDYIATLLTNRQNDGTTTGRLFLTLAPNDIDPELGGEVVPAMTGDGPRAEANASLIAAAVNALPALLDEIEAGQELRRSVEALAAEWLDAGVVEDGTYPDTAMQAEDMCARVLRALLAGGSGS